MVQLLMGGSEFLAILTDYKKLALDLSLDTDIKISHSALIIKGMKFGFNNIVKERENEGTQNRYKT